MKDADRILFVIDINSKNFSGLDKINNLLQLVKVETKTTTVFNKCENFNNYDLDKRMFKYIYGNEIFISGYHKIGTDELLDDLVKFTGKEINGSFQSKNAISIIGKPNSGKSSLINTILGNDRLVTGSKAGLTIDSIQIPFSYKDKNFSLIDTAGMRKKSRVGDHIEKQSVSKSMLAIRMSDIVILVLDSKDKLNKQDLILAKRAIDYGKSIVITLNKWDLIEDKINLKKLRITIYLLSVALLIINQIILYYLLSIFISSTISLLIRNNFKTAPSGAKV